MTREYRMPLVVLAKILKKRGVKQLICHAQGCSGVIHASDWVVSAGYDGNRKYYQKKCFDALLQ